MSIPMTYGVPWRKGEKLGDSASTPLNLVSLEVKTVINSNLPTTSITSTIMTFHNSLDRVLEGSLEFTLPDGAVICGYGLDIEGKLVDGVVLEKEKARAVFEESVRTGKSAGISEVVKGNIFKNRVYPIKPNSARLVQVSYQSEAEFNEGGDVVHKIPIRFNTQLKNLSITVECTKSEETKIAPTITSDFSGQAPSHGNGFKFESKGDRYVATAIWAKGALPQENEDFFSFSVSLAKIAQQPLVALEINPLDKNKCYFAISCMPHIHATPKDDYKESKDERVINHVGVFWDASLSRESSQPGEEKARSLELEMLKGVTTALLTQKSKKEKNASIIVTVIPFRDSQDDPVHFLFKDDGKAELKNLDEYFSKIHYDGGTNIGCLTFQKHIRHAPGKSASTPVDLYIVFTDALTTVGPEQPGDPEAPVFTVNGGDKSNTPLLKFIAETSGGQFFNKTALTNLDAIVSSFGKPVFQFLSAQFLPPDEKTLQSFAITRVTELYPGQSVSVDAHKSARFTLVGQLESVSGDPKNASVTLNLTYGQNRVVSHQHKFTLKLSSAVASTGIIGRLWAQTKITSLSSFPEKNKAQINALGREFSIVTSDTSFVVLETIDEYLKHKITPPPTREIYNEYMGRVRNTEESENSRLKSKLSRVQSMWNHRKTWHSQTFQQQSVSISRPSAPVYGGLSNNNNNNNSTDLLSSIRGGAQLRRSQAAPVSQNRDTASFASSLLSSLSMRRSASVDDDGEGGGDDDWGDSEPTSSPSSSVSIPVSHASMPLPPPGPMSSGPPPPSPAMSMSSGPPPPPPPSAPQSSPAPPPPGGPPPPSLSAPSESIQSIQSMEMDLLADVSAECAEEGELLAHDDLDEDDFSQPAPAPASEEKSQRRSSLPGAPPARNLAPAPAPPPSGGGGGGGGGGTATGTINVQKWNPSTPYLSKLKSKTDIKSAYETYITERKSYRTSPSFYFDVASFFFDKDEKVTDPNQRHGRKYGLRILTSVLELELESPQLLRIVGYKLAELGLGTLAVSVFDKVLQLRPDEPQSHRDLALVLFENNMDFERALNLYDKVIMGKWDSRYEEIELTALIELNCLIHSPFGLLQYEEISNKRKKEGLRPIPDPSLLQNLPVDLRIVMGWDTDMTDVDLHVIEPSGEECYYGNKQTRIGGKLSRDFTQGYGPEEYSVKQASAGKYRVTAKYFASHQQSLTGATTLLVYIYKNYGSLEQTKEVVTLRLQSNKDIVPVCTADFSTQPTFASLKDTDKVQALVDILVRGTEYPAKALVDKFTDKGINASTVAQVRALNNAQTGSLSLPSVIANKLAAFQKLKK